MRNGEWDGRFGGVAQKADVAGRGDGVPNGGPNRVQCGHPGGGGSASESFIRATTRHNGLRVVSRTGIGLPRAGKESSKAGRELFALERAEQMLEREPFALERGEQSAPKVLFRLERALFALERGGLNAGPGERSGEPNRGRTGVISVFGGGNAVCCELGNLGVFDSANPPLVRGESR